jgi:hypothetical protein
VSIAVYTADMPRTTTIMMKISIRLLGITISFTNGGKQIKPSQRIVIQFNSLPYDINSRWY